MGRDNTSDAAAKELPLMGYQLSLIDEVGYTFRLGPEREERTVCRLCVTDPAYYGLDGFVRRRKDANDALTCDDCEERLSY